MSYVHNVGARSSSALAVSLIHRNNLHGYFSTEIICTVIFSRTTWSSFFFIQQVLQICLAYFTSIPLLPTTENILPGHCGFLHCHFILHHIDIKMLKFHFVKVQDTDCKRTSIPLGTGSVAYNDLYSYCNIFLLSK